jgi:hypothetical protein
MANPACCADPVQAAVMRARVACMQQHADELMEHYIAMCDDNSARTCDAEASSAHTTAVETRARSWDAAATQNSEGRLRELQGVLAATTQVCSALMLHALL